MPLLNRSGVSVSGVEFFVARSQSPRDVQLCAMRFTGVATARTNALIVPFPSDAPAAERVEQVRVGDLRDGYSELFDDLARACAADDDADDGDESLSSARAPAPVPAPAPAPVVAASGSARKVAVRVCADFEQLVEFREKGFRLSKTLKPLLQHYYADGYAFVVCFLEFTPGVAEAVELTFTFPIAQESDDALFVPALTRPMPLTPGALAPTFSFTVYSVNTSRAAGLSVDEASRRLYRKLSAVVHIDAEHNALLAAAKRPELRTALLPVRLVDIVELRRLAVRGKQRNEDLLLELDEATQVYFKALRTLKEPASGASVERLLEKCLAHNPQHVAALTLLANLVQQDDARVDEAEKKFRLLLRANPVRADSLQNFALFVETKTKDHDTAEVLYTRALTIEPANPRVLANFAVFLKNVRRDYDYAEALYKRAIQAAPTSANTIGNYALFLSSVRDDMFRADQLFRLAIVLEERSAAALAAELPGALPPPPLQETHLVNAAFWKRRYEAFLEALQRSNRLQALVSSQLPPLAVPATDADRLERLNRKRSEEQKQRDQERALLERASTRQLQRLPAVVVKCVRALVFGWQNVSRADACVCLQRDDMHVPQLEADDASDDGAPAAEVGGASSSAAVACTCGGAPTDIVGSLLFRRARDAVAEATFARVLQSVQNDTEQLADADDFEQQAIGSATGASGAAGARDCVVRALNMLRGRETRLTRRCYDAMASLLTAAIEAAYAAASFSQCRDLMHMANTYRLEDLMASAEIENEEAASSLSSLTGSVDSSEEDGGLRLAKDARQATVVVAAQPALRTSTHAEIRDAAIRSSRIISATRSSTLLRVLRDSLSTVWRDRSFWESALTDELRSQQLRQSSGGGGGGGDVFDSSEALNETDAHTTALVLGQLASFATNMVHVDCEFAFIADFIDKQCVVFGIDNATRNELLQHAATASLLEMTQSSFHS
jgi:tetratricopeptide (TPR) repeat protein